MIAGWYLILFIITIIFLLFVAAFNIYEQERIKRKCKNCLENQDILLILNAIAMFLVLVLLFGYFFGRVSKSKVEAVQQNKPASPIKTHSIPVKNQILSAPKTISKTPIVGDNPFSYGDSIDIISKI
jgi:archaellum component FlaG (FlaF/FlaG flagellin family)